ncbi:hypothetical protein TNCV_2924621 [Trichonephila clavipes]|nr:hypothetical protein TNCV_2924621 [Trichonephila clavipes]
MQSRGYCKEDVDERCDRDGGADAAFILLITTRNVSPAVKAVYPILCGARMRALFDGGLVPAPIFNSLDMENTAGERCALAV